MRLLQRYVIEYCFDPLNVIAARFNEYTRQQLSASTIKRALRRMDIQCYVAIQKPYLSKRNIDKRIIWERTEQHWAVQQWSNAMLTDESSFTVVQQIIYFVCGGTVDKDWMQDTLSQLSNHDFRLFLCGEYFLCTNELLSCALLEVPISMRIELLLITTFYHLCITCTADLLPLFYSRTTLELIGRSLLLTTWLTKKLLGCNGPSDSRLKLHRKCMGPF